MAITGSIQQKNGKWYAVLNMKDINGKRKPKWIPTGYNARGNKKKAEKFLEQQISKYSENALDGNANDILLADYFDTLKDGCRRSKRKSDRTSSARIRAT